VKLVDANVLLYAVNESDPRHDEAAGWLDDQLSAGNTVGFAWLVLVAFLRLVTKIGLFPSPLPVADAVETMQRWLEQPAAVMVEPTARHASILSGLLVELGTGGNLVNDAHLAALAVEHDATVITYDSDFGRFRGVRWEQPSRTSEPAAPD
jgi:toxin-antitoxin system PIN domain toxin